MKRTRLRPMSRKREREAKIYSAARRAFLDERPRCEVCVKRKSQDVHHKSGRGKNYLLEETWLAVCRGCHDEIHSNPTWAREREYLE